MREYTPPAYRWGSILGVWEDGGIELFWQNGLATYIPPWMLSRFWPLVQRFLFLLISLVVVRWWLR